MMSFFRRTGKGRKFILAKYCRYCKQKMTDQTDPFCCACRKPGQPVDFFYRFARKTSLSEEEEDMIRDCGITLSLGSLILGVFPAFVLWYYAYSTRYNFVTRDRLSAGFAVAAAIIAALLLYYVVTGIGLLLLDRRAVKWKWQIGLIMGFLATFRSNRNGPAILSAALTSARKRRGELFLKAAFLRLAGKDELAEEIVGKPAPRLEKSQAEPPRPATEWVCSFCGYRNPVGRIECKSCGKTK